MNIFKKAWKRKGLWSVPCQMCFSRIVYFDKSITIIVIIPWSHANPAEFVSTTSACLQILRNSWNNQHKIVYEYSFTMWLQPPFFSIGAEHSGQFFALLMIHWYVSQSTWDLNCFNCSHVTTECSGSPHSKQYISPQWHKYESNAAFVNLWTANLQSGEEHHWIILSI